uniref:Uncharacterized protein n=1 Tax=Rhizophora mucronata TaxID=61149 RepID=A0A2P2N9E9_RHIMU
MNFAGIEKNHIKKEESFHR